MMSHINYDDIQETPEAAAKRQALLPVPIGVDDKPDLINCLAVMCWLDVQKGWGRRSQKSKCYTTSRSKPDPLTIDNFHDCAIPKEVRDAESRFAMCVLLIFDLFCNIWDD